MTFFEQREPREPVDRARDPLSVGVDRQVVDDGQVNGRGQEVVEGLRDADQAPVAVLLVRGQCVRAAIRRRDAGLGDRQVEADDPQPGVGVVLQPRRVVAEVPEQAARAGAQGGLRVEGSGEAGRARWREYPFPAE
ncbi:hypothetical protein AB0I46_45560 [Streptomyces spectabilis]|uniref:hypothetical protein n=1 Tax=Streptomyces spectabilis TaxID=68270 RepID=UPI0033D85185